MPRRTRKTVLMQFYSIVFSRFLQPSSSTANAFQLVLFSIHELTTVALSMSLDLHSNAVVWSRAVGYIYLKQIVNQKAIAISPSFNNLSNHSWMHWIISIETPVWVLVIITRVFKCCLICWSFWYLHKHVPHCRPVVCVNMPKLHYGFSFFKFL